MARINRKKSEVPDEPIDINNLNDRQKLFCIEYLKDLNSSRAAVAAGYSKDCANRQGCRLLTNADIREYINRQIEENLQMKKSELKQKILDKLSEIAFPAKGKKEATRDKLKALELMGKYASLFTENVNVNLPDNMQIVLNHKPVENAEKADE